MEAAFEITRQAAFHGLHKAAGGIGKLAAVGIGAAGAGGRRRGLADGGFDTGRGRGFAALGQADGR